MRLPRMHALPPQTPGVFVMRSVVVRMVRASNQLTTVYLLARGGAKARRQGARMGDDQSGCGEEHRIPTATIALRQKQAFATARTWPLHLKRISPSCRRWGMINDMSSKQVATSDLIRKTPGVIGGDACIGNRRIAVWMLVRAKQLGLADEDLLSDYHPPLTQQELAAAWQYYAAHREEIDEAIRLNEED